MNSFFRLIFTTFLFFFGWIYQQLVLAQQPVLPDSLLPVQADSLARKPFVLFDSLSYRFIGDGNFSRGNINRSLVVTRAEIILGGPVVSLSTNPRFTYGEQNHLLAERDSYIDLFLDIYKEKRVYGFGLATLEKSNLRAIDLRQLAGAGLGLRLLKTEGHSLSLTNALIFESTNFRNRSTLTTQRNSARLKGRHALLNDKIRFSHLTFVQPALNNFSNLRWSTLLSLELPLSKWISIRAGFENSYESIVESNRKRNDTRLTFGIAVGNRI
jgi:hypothetical protein